MPGIRGVGAALSALTGFVLATQLAAPAVTTAKDTSRPAAKAPPDKAFQKVKREYQVKARNKKPAERIAALKLLQDFPTGDAADLVYVTLLDDKTEEVRRAAIDFLAALRDNSEVTEKVLARMTATSRKDGMDIRAVGALEAFSLTEDDALQEQILKYLDGVLGMPEANQALLHAMIDERAAKGEAEGVLRMLMLFTRAQFFDQNFGYRRCLVQGLMEVRHQDGLTHLIDLLPQLKGLVQFDVVSHLIAATGQNFGDDAAKWKAWWAANRGLKQAPDKTPPPPFGNYGNFGEYYGIPICAKRVVFVLDTSLSMRGARIEAAKSELIRALKELHKEVYFDVIAFDNTPRVWRPELVPADERMKQMAVAAVLEQPLKFKTASYDALEAAFGLNPEAIYFLSDGAPFGGKIDDPNEIIATVSAVNRVRRISIHSIGIDTGDPKTSVFGKFMKGLAEANWGVFKPVN
jgi:hypothetical protein